VRCRTHESDAGTDQEQVRDQSLKAPAGLGPRLVGLAVLCVTLFALATVVGLFADHLG
jgi:hypothetical protein